MSDEPTRDEPSNEKSLERNPQRSQPPYLTRSQMDAALIRFYNRVIEIAERRLAEQEQLSKDATQEDDEELDPQ